MRTVLSTIVGLLLSFWLGSLLHQLLGVMWLFHALPRERAAEAAASLFHITERALLIAGGLAALTAFFWRLALPGRLRTALLFAVLWTLLIGAASTYFISARIDALRISGQTQTPQFKQYHAASSISYLVQVGSIAAAHILFVLSLRPTAKDQLRD